MSFLTAGSAFFLEDFDPSRPSAFDPELDEAVSSFALARGAMRGWCNVTGAPVTFTIDDPNLRENVVAEPGGSRSRHRQIACALSLVLYDTPLVDLPVALARCRAEGRRVLLAETRTPVHAALAAGLGPDLLTTSEYFGPEHAPGAMVDGVRHEDLQRLSFPDASLDLIVTSDVMEHVADAEAAEREIVRVLRPGGAYCFTVPLTATADDDLICARGRPDGTIEYFREPMYHGDPLRPEGVLVYRIFSVRGMARRFAALGAPCTTYRLWSKGYGLLGPGCWVHVARKPPLS